MTLTVPSASDLSDLNEFAQIDLMFRALSGGEKICEIEPGFYSGPLNTSILFRTVVENDYPQLPGGRSCLAVCDEPQQFIDLVKVSLASDSRAFLTMLTEIKKADQPEKGGWRWHMWGEYLGTKTQQHEYLYDEGPEFESVWVVHVSQIKASVAQ